MSVNRNPPVRPTAILLIDTCILCEILNIPFMSSKEEHKKYFKKFLDYKETGVRFVLPLATLIETGNHIAQNGDGNQRRQVASKFVGFVRDSMKSESPFLNADKIWNAHVEEWIKDFPDQAMRDTGNGKGIGLGDCSIQKDKEIVKQNFGVTNLPVDIWSKDKHNA